MKIKIIGLSLIVFLVIALLFTSNGKNNTLQALNGDKPEVTSQEVPEPESEEEIDAYHELYTNGELSPDDMRDVLEQEYMEEYKQQMTEEIQDAMFDDYEESMPHGFPY